MSDFLTMQGGAIKALGKSTFEGKSVGKLGGVLCRFSGPDDADTYGDYFDTKTDFSLMPGATMQSPVLYHHTLDPQISTMKLGLATLTMTDDGVVIEAQLDLDNPVAAAKYELAQKGKLGWSSGTASHLVKREQVAVKNGKPINHVLTWPLGLDASLTPTPAERRNVAVALKSLEVAAAEEPEDAAAAQASYLKWLENENTSLNTEMNALRVVAMRREQMHYIEVMSGLMG